MQLPYESRWENAGLQRVHLSSPFVDLMNAYLKKGQLTAFASGLIMAYASGSLTAKCLMLFG